MNIFYDEVANLSSKLVTEQNDVTHHPNGLRGCGSEFCYDALGIVTKTHVIRSISPLQRPHDFILQDQSAKLLPLERVSNCLKKRVTKKNPRYVKYNTDREKAHWSNVQRCGSVWTCPVCAKQISEKRRVELQKAMSIWKYKYHGSVYLLTLTFSHNAKQSLKSLILGLRKAMKRFYETTRVQQIFKALTVKHKIKGLENTYGSNGWHPHHHILLFVEYSSDFFSYRDELASLWIKACVKSGLDAPSMEYGLDIRDGKYASNYVSKWGLEHEMTKGHIKRAKKGGYSPFDLLHFSLFDGEMNGRTAESLWQEFGVAMKGARQLEWSRGFKELLSIEEKSDEELAVETEKNSITLDEVSCFIFSLLCKYQLRHIYLKCWEHDYSTGENTANQLIDKLLLYEYERMSD